MDGWMDGADPIKFSPVYEEQEEGPDHVTRRYLASITPTIREYKLLSTIFIEGTTATEDIIDSTKETTRK